MRPPTTSQGGRLGPQEGSVCFIACSSASVFSAVCRPTLPIKHEPDIVDLVEIAVHVLAHRLEDRADRARQDLHVQPGGPIVNVSDFELQFAVGAPADHSSEPDWSPGRILRRRASFVVVLGEVVHQQWSGTDEAHLPPSRAGYLRGARHPQIATENSQAGSPIKAQSILGSSPGSGAIVGGLDEIEHHSMKTGDISRKPA